MKKQCFFLSTLVILFAGCASSLPTKNKAVSVLPSGAWTVSLPSIVPAWTPAQSTKMRRKYFQYYSALQAKSSNCKRYSRASLSLGADGRAYECRANGNYITEDVLALGKPW